jgi:hypothetical protein
MAATERRRRRIRPAPDAPGDATAGPGDNADPDPATGPGPVDDAGTSAVTAAVFDPEPAELRPGGAPTPADLARAAPVPQVPIAPVPGPPADQPRAKATTGEPDHHAAAATAGDAPTPAGLPAAVPTPADLAVPTPADLAAGPAAVGLVGAGPAADGSGSRTAAEGRAPARTRGRPMPGRPTSAPPARPVSGGGTVGGADERETERGLRGLVGSGSSQVGVGAAMRARDATRPTPQDLADAEERLVIVRRNWQPREDLPRNR